MAKSAAVKDLIDNHRDEYVILRAGWLDHYKKQYGYKDGRRR